MEPDPVSTVRSSLRSGCATVERVRQRAIERLDPQPGELLLILGSGTGMGLEYLPSGVRVTAIDVAPEMVRRTKERGESLGLDVDARVGDARSLPFDDDTFDAVVLHLVLSVVPDLGEVVAESARVLNTDGRISMYDKFISEGSEPSLLRRAVNPAPDSCSLTSFDGWNRWSLAPT